MCLLKEPVLIDKRREAGKGGSSEFGELGRVVDGVYQKNDKKRIVMWGKTYRRASCGNQGMNAFLEEGKNLLLPA